MSEATKISAFVEVSDNTLSSVIAGSPHTWLDTPIDADGTTFRAWMLAEVGI